MQESTTNVSSTPSSLSQPPHKSWSVASFIKEIFKFFLLVLLVVVPVRLFVAQPFIVVGPSMEPNFFSNNYLIVDELSYHLRSPERGEVVVLHDPRDHKMFLIKRVIGLPGDTVEIADGNVTIKNSEHPDGMKLTEPYISAPGRSDEHMSVDLANDQYFVMGDNRPYSLDSRALGPVSDTLIVGRALVRLMPISQAAILPGNYNE
jgi:signal peptidase I